MNDRTGPIEPVVVIPKGMIINSSLTLDEVTEKYVEPGINYAIDGVDDRHEKGCIRRYGAIPDPWIDHKDCPCHKGSK